MTSHQQGNVLFLILIAVVLFAALSYAVTQSSRGGGNSDKERDALIASQLVQAVANMRVAVQRMSLTKGISPADIVFCDSDESECDNLGDSTPLCTSGRDCLFSSDGGGLTSLNLPQGYGFYLYDERAFMSISNVGTAASDIALQIKADYSGVPEMTLGVCDAINKGFGFSTQEEITQNWIYGDGLEADGHYDFCVDTLSTFNFDYRYIAVISAF